VEPGIRAYQIVGKKNPRTIREPHAHVKHWSHCCNNVTKKRAVAINLVCSGNCFPIPNPGRHDDHRRLRICQRGRAPPRPPRIPLPAKTFGRLPLRLEQHRPSRFRGVTRSTTWSISTPSSSRASLDLVVPWFLMIRLFDASGECRKTTLWPERKLFCSGGHRKAKLVAGVFFLREKGIARGGQKRRAKRYRVICTPSVSLYRMF
jgi:hypothetical protein